MEKRIDIGTRMVCDNLWRVYISQRFAIQHKIVFFIRFHRFFIDVMGFSSAGHLGRRGGGGALYVRTSQAGKSGIGSVSLAHNMLVHGTTAERERERESEAR
jgi:hypothetical protein